MADWLNVTFASFDNSLLELFHNLYLKCGNVLTPVAKVLAVIGDIPLLFVFWLGFVLFFTLKDKKVGMLMCGSIVIEAILVTFVLKTLVFRPRPYNASEIYKTWWQVFNLPVDWDTSFPSGHSAATFAGVLAYAISRKKPGYSVLLFIFALLMGSSRIYLCVHYPSDVVFGYAMGAIAVLICIPIVKGMYIFFRKNPKFFLSEYCLTGKITRKKK